MERYEMKWMIGGIFAFILVLFSFLQPFRTSERGRGLEDWLTVSMPRPIKEMILGFSLDGRSVRRELEMVASAQKTVLPVTPTKDSINATKAGVDKKAADKKKQQEQTRLAKARQAEKHFYQALQERAFRMRVIQESEKYRRALLAQQQNQYPEFEYGRAQPKKQESNVPDEKKQDVEDEGMTASAWKSLVLAQPTRENIGKMVEAYNEGKLEEDAFYDIVAALLKDNSQEKQKVGLWALTASTSFQGFSMAAHMALTETDAQDKKVLTDYMASYNNLRGLTFLDQALRSRDQIVTAAAAQVITQGVEKVKANQTPSTQGRGRIEQQGKLTLDSYKRFVPTLRWLITNTSSLSQWAQNLLSQLQANSSPA